MAVDVFMMSLTHYLSMVDVRWPALYLVCCPAANRAEESACIVEVAHLKKCGEEPICEPFHVLVLLILQMQKMQCTMR